MKTTLILYFIGRSLYSRKPHILASAIPWSSSCRDQQLSENYAPSGRECNLVMTTLGFTQVLAPSLLQLDTSRLVDQKQIVTPIHLFRRVLCYFTPRTYLLSSAALANHGIP